MNAAADGDDREQAAAGRPTSRPRNYLAGTERRRIFWRVMPPAMVAVFVIGWLERSWFPPAGAPAKVDTRLTVSPGPTLGPGDFQVEQPREPEPVVRSAETLAAPAEQLALIRDDSFHRSEEVPVWIQIFLTLRSADPNGLRAVAQPVAFGELFGQPRSFRGRPVRFAGKLRGLERRSAPTNDYGITHYYESWVEPDDGTSSPIVVHSLAVPPDLQSSNVHAPIAVEGYFFKNFAYLAKDHELRRAPLVLAATLRLRPPAPPSAVVYHGAWLLGYALLAVVVATVATVMCFGLGIGSPSVVRRPVEDASDLQSALAGADIVSTAEALQRLEAADRAAEQVSAAESTPSR